MLLIMSMIFSPMTIANDTLENIEKTDKGYLFTEEQIIELANYIEKLRTENQKLEAKLDQAEKELEKAYKDDNIFDLRSLSDAVTGAGIASLIILISQNF